MRVAQSATNMVAQSATNMVSQSATNMVAQSATIIIVKQFPREKPRGEIAYSSPITDHW
jgi:hypothetical protein